MTFWWRKCKLRFEEYLVKENYKSVAVYGMGEVGLRIYDRLVTMNTVETVVGIEKLNYEKKENYNIFHLYEDELPVVDVVLVVPYKEFDYIKWELDNFVSDVCKIVSIQDFEWEE